MLKASFNREIKGGYYIVNCEECSVTSSKNPPVICAECQSIIWCANCKRYNTKDTLDWICAKCHIKHAERYRKSIRWL